MKAVEMWVSLVNIISENFRIRMSFRSIIRLLSELKLQYSLFFFSYCLLSDFQGWCLWLLSGEIQVKQQQVSDSSLIPL